MSPTARTIKKLSEDGYLADVVERRIPHSKTTKDFIGIIDIIAINDDETLGVQATTSDNAANRITKLVEIKRENTIKWLKCLNRRLEIWGWRKLKGKGWNPRIIELALHSELINDEQVFYIRVTEGDNSAIR